MEQSSIQPMKQGNKKSTRVKVGGVGGWTKFEKGGVVNIGEPL